MEIVLWMVVIYLAIGLFKAIRHLGSGKVGAWGPFATLVATMLFWPFFESVT
jgi:uncharacterized membrane protein (DUF2068 family)